MREYLRTVDTVKDATVDITWAPEAVRMGRENVIRSLRGISGDGLTFFFDRAEPQLRDVKPGSILLVWGVALGRVTGTQTRADTLVIRTAPVTVDEAFRAGRIEWNNVPDVRRGFLTQMLNEVKPVPAHHSMAPSRAGVVRYAGWRLPRAGSRTAQDSSNGAPKTDLPTASDILLGPATGSVYGVLGSEDIGYYVFHLTVPAAGPGLEIDLDVFRTDWSPGKSDFDTRTQMGAILESKDSLAAYKKSRYRAAPSNDFSKIKPSDLIDIRVHSDLHVNFGANRARLLFGGATAAATAAQGVSGFLNVTAQGRMGPNSSFNSKAKFQVPVSYNLPFIVGGVPMMLQISVAFIVRVALPTSNSWLQGAFHAQYSGAGGFSMGAGRLQPNGSVKSIPVIDVDPADPKTILGFAPSALQVSLQDPRIGLGVGLLNTGLMGYIDNVFTASFVNEGQGIAPCRQIAIIQQWSAGWVAQLWPGLGSGAKIPLGPPDTTSHAAPDLRICHVLG